MSFPDGVQTVTLTAGTTGYRTPDGAPCTGAIRFTPSVARVTSAEHGIIALGAVNAPLGASGQFTENPNLLATDADGFEPSGWTYRVDEEFTNAPGRAWSVSLPAAAPTVALPSLSPVESTTGTVYAAAVTSVNAETGAVVMTAAKVGADPAGTAAAAVAAHTESTDPHGDRAYTNTQVAGRAAASTQVIAGTGLTGGGTLAADRTLTVAFGGSGTTVCVGNDARLSDPRTPTLHAASHGSGGSDAITLAQSQVTGLTTALATKPTAPASSTDNAIARYDGTTGLLLQNSAVTIADDGTTTVGGALTVGGYTTLAGGQFNSDFAAFGDLRLIGSSKAYRFRRGGSALNFDGGGTDLLVSVWSDSDFAATQHSYLRLSADAQNIQIAGRTEFADTLYGSVRHVLDAAANTVGLYGATPVARQTVSGSRGDSTALTSLIAKLAATGIIADSSTAGVTAAWRQRHLPDPVVAESLYAGTAPTISTAQTTAPTTGYVKYAPAGVALAGTDVTGPFSYMGAGSFAIGTVAPDPSYVLPLSKYPNTYSSGQGIWSVEFGTDAQIIQVRMKYISTATMFRLSVDGRKVTDLMQSSGGTTAGSGHLISIDFGSATPRRIRLDFATFPFGGVYIPPTATLWGVPSQGGRLMVFGDSLSDGSAQNTGAGAGTWFARAARLLGSTDAWEQARGGTGYITAGSYATFADRVASDVVAWNPSRLIVWGGYNDNTGSQSAIATAAASLYAAIKAGLPGCETYVIGCWSPTGSPGATITNTDTTLRTAAAAAGLPFISPITGSVYDAAGALVATSGAWITAANVAYIGADAIHPTDAGHIYLSKRITAAIRQLMSA